MVLSRQELLRLMRLTEDVPDVRQESISYLCVSVQQEPY